ncbi:MAG: hypothetical protein N2712_03380 [Brevinematales bacterium]|nr:hypothetical protein [Brevinematales bacterium]
MLLGKVWKLRYRLLSLLLIVAILGCEQVTDEQTKAHFSENIVSGSDTSKRSSILEQVEKFKDVKFGLGEKFFIEGVDFLSTMNYDRAIYSFNKSIFYNPIPPETKYFLAKSYLNAGFIKNSIDIFEEIKNTDLSSFVLPKLSSIYSRLSLSFGYNPPIEYYSITNISGIQGRNRFFALPSSIRFAKDLGIVLNSFSDNLFLTVDNQLSFKNFNLGKRVIDVVYQDSDNSFWIITFSEIYKYQPGWFNLNVFGLNTLVEFSYSGVNFKRIVEIGEFLYVLDEISKKILIVSKYDGKVMMTFPERPFDAPTDLEKDGENILVSDSKTVKVFGKYGEILRQFEFPYNLNGFCVYKDGFILATDNGLIIYNLRDNKYQIVSDKPYDDVVMGNEDKIYAISTKRNEMEVFGNVYQLTHNLDVDIKGIFVGKFPVIGMLVGVRDINQNIIHNLNRGNFEVLESGVNVFMPEVEMTYSFLKKKNLHIVIEKSREVYEYIDEIKSFVRYILNRLDASDYVNITIAGENLVSMGQRNISVLYPLDFIDKNFSKPDSSYNTFDGVSKAITELFYSVRNNVVLLITSGNLERDTSYRNIYNVIDYSYYNYIPIYVISINNSKEMEMLTSSVGGKYYNKTVFLSPDIFLEDFNKNKVFRYLVVFKSVYETVYPDERVVDVEVRVRYNNIVGKDKIKYIFPKAKKPEGQ